MEYLFDPDKSHFTAWLQLHDIDIDPNGESTLFEFTPILKSVSTPLYYAALCGFQHPVEQLIVKYPQHVDAIGGYYMTPAVAALAGRHFRLAQLTPSQRFIRGPTRRFQQDAAAFRSLLRGSRDGSKITRLQGEC